MGKIIKPGERVSVLGTYRTWKGVLTRRGYEGFTGTFSIALDGEDEESLVCGQIHREEA